MLVHDLRNPLAALQSNLGYLGVVMEDLDQDSAEALSDSQLSCDAVARLLDNMEVLGQSLAGVLDNGEVSEIELALSVDEAIRSVRSQAESHGVEVRLLDRARLVRAPIPAQRHLLQIVIGNLLRNSIQHCPSGGVIEVDIVASDANLELRIHDPGALLEGSAIREAFSAEGQISGKRKPGGRYSRGLGLYIALLVARELGAKIRVVDPEAGGNCFVLAFTQ